MENTITNLNNATPLDTPKSLAEIDYLTGLANRRGLYDYYSALDQDVVLHAMFIDIDNFKRVNDVYGHSMGDKLLIKISHLIQEHAKGFTSRIGGDEYVVLMDGSLTENQVTTIAQNLLDNMNTIDFRKDILSLISLSIGIVLNQHASEVLDEVLSKCDAAMYQAKYDGKNRYTVYTSYEETFEITKNIEMEMEDALRNKEFHVYLQPKVNMLSSELYGAEALSRWIHPVDGLRPPVAYIPLFEKNGFISALDMYVFEEVCRMKASWAGEKYEHIPISINMSRLHLYNKDFPNTLEAIAMKYGIPNHELELEITESTFIKDNIELIKTVNLLQEKGFLVSIDDFGSGFSALNLLKDLTVDTIKIDREFLQFSSNNSRGKKVIRNVISMCRDLKMDVVAEGIETKEQIDFVTRCGCQIAQGFYYAKPLPEKEFILFAEEYLNNILSFYDFHLDGDLKSEDGTLEGIFRGDENGKYDYTTGIYKDKKALSLYGGPTQTNMVEIPSDAIMNDSYTISLWIRPRELHPWSSAFYIKFETGFSAIIPFAWEGHSSFRIRYSKEVNGWYDASGCHLQLNTWSHYVMTYSAKTETSIAFINGQAVSVLENVPVNCFVRQIMLGGDVFQNSFIGDLCELRIYNEAKDFNFVQDLHQSYVSKEGFIGFPVRKKA